MRLSLPSFFMHVSCIDFIWSLFEMQVPILKLIRISSFLLFQHWITFDVPLILGKHGLNSIMTSQALLFKTNIWLDFRLGWTWLISGNLHFNFFIIILLSLMLNSVRYDVVLFWKLFLVTLTHIIFINSLQYPINLLLQQSLKFFDHVLINRTSFYKIRY